MSNHEQTKFDFLGKKIPSDQVISDIMFNQDMRTKAKCHLCFNEQSALCKCVKCLTYFCLKCVDAIKRTEENVMSLWICFVCRKECPCKSCAMMKQAGFERDKACLICKSATSLCRIDSILEKITIDEQLKKEINDKQWLSFLFQSNNKSEKYLCDNCYNRCMPIFVMNLQNKPEQKQGYYQPQANFTQPKFNDKKLEGNLFNSSLPSSFQAQFFNDVKGMTQAAVKTDQGYPVMNQQLYPILQGGGQALLNDKGQFGSLMNDFAASQGKVPNQAQSYSVPIPSIQGLNISSIIQTELNQKVLLMMIYEAITVFFNQTLKNMTNILENINALLNHVHCESRDNGMNSIEKNMNMEMYLFKTAEESMQTIMSIQIFQEQLKKLVAISLTPQELINNPHQFGNFSPKSEMELLNIIKARSQMNNDFFLQNMQLPPQSLNMPNFNPIPPSQLANQNDSSSNPLKYQTPPVNKDSKPQQQNNCGSNQAQPSIPMSSQQQPPMNFYQAQQLNSLFANQAFSPSDLMNFFNLQQQNKPKPQAQQSQPIASNVNSVSGLPGSILPQSTLMSSKLPSQEFTQMLQNPLLQMHPDIFNPAAFIQFQKMFEQKQSDSNLASAQFKQ